MIAFGHTALGASIGLITYHYFSNQPLEGLLISGTTGVISHYISDFIPHGHFFSTKNYAKKIISAIIFDFLLSVLIFTGIAYFKWNLELPFWFILFGIGGAQLPDIVNGLVLTNKLAKKGIPGLNYEFHKILHWHGEGKKTLLIGKRDLWQLAVVLISLYLLTKA